MSKKNSYEKIIELNSKRMKLQEEINDLQPDAVIQLYEMGYAMDNIALMLKMGKITILEILHKSKIKIREKGRRKKEKNK